MGGVPIMTPTWNHVENEMERAPVMTPTENHVEMKCEYIRSYFAAWVLMAVLGAHLTEQLSATPRSVYVVFSRLGLSDYNRENLTVYGQTDEKVCSIYIIKEALLDSSHLVV
jgi:hypothetical protein